MYQQYRSQYTPPTRAAKGPAPLISLTVADGETTLCTRTESEALLKPVKNVKRWRVEYSKELAEMTY
jgi:hypothetical protein